MSELQLTNITGTSISTPGAGVTTSYVDSLDKKLRTKDDTGFVDSYLQNTTGSNQTPAAGVRTYITGSRLAIGPQKLQVGSMFRWNLDMTKTAAGTATTIFDICVGTAGTTADVARVTFTKPAGTAAIDHGIVEVNAVARSIGVSGIIAATFWMIHNGNTVGHMTIPAATFGVLSAGFDMTVANLSIGLCITTGALDAITIQQCQAEAWDI